MHDRAMEGTCLASLVRMAVPVCQEAQRRCPRTGPGRKPEIEDWVMAVLIMTAVAKRKKTKAAQYRFLSEHRQQLLQWMGADRFPSQSTYYERYRRAHTLFETALEIQSERAARAGIIDPMHVAVDKSLVAARGPLWHKSDRKKSRIPKGLRGVDCDSDWGRSQHDGWVQGYSYEVVVTCGKKGLVWPLLASADTASKSEHASFPAKIEKLPQTTKTVAADAGYDSNAHAEAIEHHPSGRRTGRRFLCPENPRNTPPENPCERTRRRNAGDQHQWRRQRKEYLQSTRGVRLYARRGETVEPFNGWFKALFELEDRVWHRGLDNNRTQLLAAMFVFQLLLRYNRKRKRFNGQVKWILDVL